MYEQIKGLENRKNFVEHRERLQNGQFNGPSYNTYQIYIDKFNILSILIYKRFNIN